MINERERDEDKGQRNRPLQNFPSHDERVSLMDQRGEEMPESSTVKHNQQRGNNQSRQRERQSDRDQSNLPPGTGFAHIIGGVQRLAQRIHAAGGRPDRCQQSE